MKMRSTVMLISCVLGIVTCFSLKAQQIFSVELDQLLTPRAAVEFLLQPQTGLRGSLGVSVLGFPTVSYGLVAVRHMRSPDSKFQLDLEGGLPVGYFNLLEGACIDWDPNIDDPFAGWLWGGGISWGWRSRQRQFSLFTGCSAWWEVQRDSGWKGPGPIFLVLLRYSWLKG
ncbi:hypothetical protein [Marispirochaeta aestuarii]|uniref:hypothetical protein n=1 Tax=Marispirochaeta aestuarii TaxID=1963862 RepID=UPI0029C6489D|nr:hypothetical protein [Marispirochaeta aestuarii]